MSSNEVKVGALTLGGIGLLAVASPMAQEVVKDPYWFDFVSVSQKARERDIEKQLVTHITQFLLELGKGFSFVGSQYKISTENQDYYIDLLFYHLELRCYIVVELKNTEFNSIFACNKKIEAVKYYNIFRKEFPELKVAVVISLPNMREENNGEEANEILNKFYTNIKSNYKNEEEYEEDIKFKFRNGNIDILIVVDKLLTGFDAPELNTLYVDRTLKGGNLIQAYSRTNRMHNLVEKPWGNVINYRWPVQNEFAMNEAFYVYSNRASANVQTQMDITEMKDGNEEYGIISKPFSEVLSDLQNAIHILSELTDGFRNAPPGENDQDKVFENLNIYNQLLSKLKQYTEDDEGNVISAYDDPESFYEKIGISQDQEVLLTTTIADKIKENRAERDNIDISQVNLEMVHIHDVTINYDYLTELIAQMADEVHDDEMEKATQTKEEIHNELAKSDVFFVRIRK